MIWDKKYTLEEVNKIFNVYMTKLLDIKAVEILPDGIIASMPITDNVKQPYGILHGGASVVLAESVGSIASNMVVGAKNKRAVGLEINANHIRPGISGLLYATCKRVHLGKTTHIWDIQIKDEKDHLICISRLTTAIVEKKKKI